MENCEKLHVLRVCEIALVILLPRDAMRKRVLCCRPVSVRPSVRHVGVRIQTAEDIVKLFVRPSSPIVLVFLTPAPSFVLQNNQQTSSWSITLMVVVGHGMRAGAHLAS